MTGGCAARGVGAGQGWPQGQDMADEESWAGLVMVVWAWWWLGSPVAMGPAIAWAGAAARWGKAGAVRLEGECGPKAQTGPWHCCIYKRYVLLPGRSSKSLSLFSWWTLYLRTCSESWCFQFQVFDFQIECSLEKEWAVVAHTFPRQLRNTWWSKLQSYKSV